MPRNPNWAVDELILALDLYFKVELPHWSSSHPEVLELSRTLNSLPIHPIRYEGFRNPASVYMKLCNFLRFDPQYPGTGLPGGSRLEEIVWATYANDLPLRRRVSKLILEGSALIAEALEPPEEYGFLEGRILTQLHRQRERNPTVVEKKKLTTLQATGHLACEVCEFDFEECYGELGRRFAECHHLVPLAELNLQRRTRLEDLAIVCANCHRMLHRGQALSIKELRSRLVQSLRLGSVLGNAEGPEREPLKAF